MTLKYKKIKTSGIREIVSVDKSGLWKGGPLKSLTMGMSRTGGRNNQGRMTVRHRKGACRKVYREIEFKRQFMNGIDYVVKRLEYDPNRSAHIALLETTNPNAKKFCYIIAPEKLAVGAIVSTSTDKRIDEAVGNAMPIGLMREGVTVHCIESKQGKGACYARSAGVFARILGFSDKGKVIVRFKSGEEKLIDPACMAVIGTVSNADHMNIVLGKAGASCWLGRRPSVRGIAMNPVDHHNGGRANGGTIFASPEGLCAKGLKTRKNKRTTKSIAKKRGKK